MNDKNRPLVHEVCSDCFRACPQDLSLRYTLPDKCRSPGFHRYADRVLVTCHKGVLVRVPPPDNMMASLRGRFVMCKSGQECKRSRCSYPHTEEERDFWNSALEDFKVHQRPPFIPPLISPVQHVPVQHVPLQHVPVPPPRRFPPPPPPLHHHHHPFVPHQPFLSPVPHGRLPLTHPQPQYPEQHWPNITPQPPYSSGPLLVRPPAESLPTPCAPPPVDPPIEPPHTKPCPVRHPSIHAPHVSKQRHRDAALPLTRETYKKKFTALLYLEEEVRNKLLKEKCNDEYQLFVKPRDHAPGSLQRHMVEHVRYAYIYGMSGDQMMYAIQASECVYILDPTNNNRFVAKADILPKENFRTIADKLYIAFNRVEASNLEEYFQIGHGKRFLTVLANFEVGHWYFKQLRRAVESLSEQAVKRIMPTEGDFATGLDLTRVPLPKHCDSLKVDKEHQFQALQLVLFSRSLAPVIIPGPFGTGKTRILAVAAYNFLNYAEKKNSEAHILVCCHHQISANTFVESYFGDAFKRKLTFNVRVVRLTRKNYHIYDSQYENLYVPLDRFRDQVEKYYKSKYLIVVTTFSTALNIGNLFGDSFFTHILLDEGAQVREPEAVAPLCMANEETKIVIAGDSQQVGPALLVLGDEPNELGLGTSLLERLQSDYKKDGGNHKDYIAHLCTNHRCHEDILDLPSQLFYNSSLLSRSTASTFSCAPYPLVFICSSVADPHPNEEDISKDEAEILIGLFRQFSRKGDTRSFQEGTCFMALSRRQVTLLNHSLTKQESSRVKCFPSYEIQGREFKALFISTVECVHDGFKSANPTKSFCNRYVFNTALTRAQSLVVVAGNPFLLLKVEAAMPEPMGCWRAYLKRCIDHNTFIVPKHFDNESTVLTELKQLVEQPEKEFQPNPDTESFRTISQVDFDARGLKYHMSDHGVTVIIPENAVTTRTLLSIGVYYVNSFQLPEDHRLVSEVFWIKTSVLLQKNVELYVPHFVKVRDDNDSNKLGFFIASDVRIKDVQTLTEVPKNTSSFEPESCYGKLVMEHFCSGCILERIDGNGLPLRYLVTRVFPKDFRKLENWRADFVFSYALKSCLKVIEKQYSTGNYSFTTSSVTFTQPSATLDYNFEPVTGWFITQVDMLREISREKIDFRNLLKQSPGGTAKEDVILLQHLEEINDYPPRLMLGIIRTELARNHLKTDVIVKGVDQELKTTIFALCPGVPEAASVSDLPPSKEHITHHANLAENKQNQFLKDAILALQDHFVKDWYILGLHLGLHVTDLNVIETNSLSYVDKRTCVRQMLTKWKETFDQKATWEEIVIAIEKTGNKCLARKVEDEFIQPQKQSLEEKAPYNRPSRAHSV